MFGTPQVVTAETNRRTTLFVHQMYSCWERLLPHTLQLNAEACITISLIIYYCNADDRYLPSLPKEKLGLPTLEESTGLPSAELGLLGEKRGDQVPEISKH